MKKLLFIMIMATTLITVTPIGASNQGMNERYKVKTMDSQISLSTALDVQNISNVENRFQPEKIKLEKRIRKIDRTQKRIARKGISANKKDRLFGILLLAYGGKR